MAREPQMSQKAQELLGLPPGLKTYSPYPFGGMNSDASAIGVPDSEFPYIENFIRLGDGNFRTLWDLGAPVFTAPDNLTIIYFKFYTIEISYYCAIFLSDGSAVQLNMNTMVQTPLGPPTTFYQASTGFLPYATQWGSTYLMICNRNTPNDYWAWDGFILYGAGGAAPNGVILSSGGVNYNTPPTVTVFGGSGTGMILTPNIVAGSIINITVNNPGVGYKPGDIAQVQLSDGGSDDSAELIAVLTATGVGAVSVAAGGSGFTSAPDVTILPGSGTAAGGYWTFVFVNGSWVPIFIPTAGSGGGGSGATAFATVENGSVVSVTVTNAGSGYTSTPQILFTGGGGIGVVAKVLLQPTTLASVTVVKGGTGYGGPAPAGDVEPLIDVVGGGGSGATVTCATTIGHTPIVTVNVTAAGTGYTSTPALVIKPGNNHSAYATITLMPYGVSGSAMETFLSRVWIVNPASARFATIPAGNLYTFTAPGSITDFATADGGGNGQNTDSFLQTTYTNVRQSAGYLYFFGDCSVSVVSNVNTAGNPLATTYSYQNADAQNGLSWRDSLVELGRILVMANETGVYQVTGGAAKKVSDKIDQFLHDHAVYPAAGGVTPSSAIGTFFNNTYYLNLITITDPDLGGKRNVMVLWNEKEWVIASQSETINIIGSQKVGSQYFVWGSDGKDLHPMFVQPSSALAKRFDTKIYGADSMFIQKSAQATWLQAIDNSPNLSGISGTFILNVAGIGDQNGVHSQLQGGLFNTMLEQPNFAAPSWSLWGSSMDGIVCTGLGLRFTSNSPDFTIGNLVIGYTPVLAYFGQ